MTYKEIAVVLKVRVGFDVSERRIKRLVKMNRLRRRVYDEDADATAVIEFIWSQLQRSGRMHGYRWMHRVLAGYHVRRHFVQMICRVLDPAGVELRRRHRLTRRRYFAAEPDFIWHVDGTHGRRLR